VDLERVQEIWRTPPYHDYHWVMRPDVQERFGEAFPQQVTEALLALDAANPEHAGILELFGAERFIETENGNYAQIEAIGRQIGQIVESE
jgi:phosphonate transport system substrate-binding protein